MTRNRSFQDQLDKANAGIEWIAEQIGDDVLTGDEAKPRPARLRDIITSVVVHPDPAKKGSIILDIQGKLNALTGWESRDPRSVGSNGSGGA